MISPTPMAKPTLPLALTLRTLAPAAQNGLWVTVIAATAYFALFRLPFWFPPRQRLWSASYAFGFNNSVAMLAMAGLLGGVTLLYLLRRRREPTGLPIAFMPEIPFRDHRSAVLAFAIAALCYVGLTFLMYVYNVHSAPWLMWETRHLLHRTCHVHRRGRSFAGRPRFC